MKKLIAFFLALVLCLSLLPVVTLAASEDPVEAGYLVQLPVKLDGQTEVYMGIGQSRGDINLFQDGSTSDESAGFVLSVCLWAKIMNGGQADYRRLEGQQAERVFDELENISLDISAAPGATNVGTMPTLADAPPEFDYLRQAGTRCLKSCLLFSAQNGGSWRFTASCKAGGKTYSASATVTLIVPKNITINCESGTGGISEVDTVDDVNAALQREFAKIEQTSGEYNIFVRLNETKRNEAGYTGQIVIPTLQSKTSYVFVYLTVADNPIGEMPCVKRATLRGGVYSQNVGFSAAYIDFIGAGKAHKTWPTGSDAALVGKDNIALAGDSGATSGRCSFTGYDRAIQCTKGLRACGGYNTFKDNNIAWYLDAQEGGNAHAVGCRFENNNIAIHVKQFCGMPSEQKLTDCLFWNNKTDIKNETRFRWYVPGNTFIHSRPHSGRAAAEDAYEYALTLEGTVSPYPLAAYYVDQYDQQPYVKRNDYLYDYQIDENGDTISNDLAENYPIPSDVLPGMIYHVAGFDEEAMTDEALVTMEFAMPEDTPTVAALSMDESGPAPLALLAAPAAEPTPTAAFNATVKIDRSDASKIVFTMHDPCEQTVTITLPCTFADGTVTRDGQPVEGARFDGTNVIFQTNQGGTYTIIRVSPETEEGEPLPGYLNPLITSGALSGQNAAGFRDVSTADWFYDAVRYVNEYGLMTGTSSNQFSPNAPVTRGMVMTILARREGIKTNRYSPWYAAGVEWAKSVGISDGTNPEEAITREQLAVMLYRYAAYKGYDMNRLAELAFADANSVSDYATTGLRWAVASGLMTGTSTNGMGKLLPQQTATRAQLAAMLQRFFG